MIIVVVNMVQPIVYVAAIHLTVYRVVLIVGGHELYIGVQLH
jgi:hypothetical protein